VLVASGQFYNDFTIGQFPNSITLSSTGVQKNYLLTLGSDGMPNWGQSFGASLPSDVAVDGEGNIYASGSFVGTVDFDNSPNTYNLSAPYTYSYNSYVIKLNEFGELIWGKVNGGNTYKPITSLICDKKGNLLMTGAYSGTVDFDPGPDKRLLTAVGASDVYVQKLSPAGKLIWVGSIGGNYDDIPGKLAIDIQGNIVMSGEIFDKMDADPRLGTYFINPVGYLSDDIFLIRLDADGAFVWAGVCGTLGSQDQVQKLLIAEGGELWLSGKTVYGINLNFGGGTNPVPNVSGYVGFLAVYSLPAIPTKALSDVGGGASVFPNPTSTSIRVSVSPEFEGRLISIYGPDGRLIKTQTAVSPQFEVQMPSPAGLYLLAVRNRTGKRTMSRVLKVN